MTAREIPGGRVEISLEVDTDSDPISGRLHDRRRGKSHDFQGWLQFMAALDSARGPRRERPRAKENER